MMYLEAELGAMVPAAIQQLDPGTALAVMTYLGDKYVVVDPNQPPAQGVANLIAVPGQTLVEQGIQLEGKPTAAQQVQSLPSGTYALANLDDAKAVATGGSVAQFHITTADSQAVASLAGPGSSLSVLWPLGTNVGAETPKKSMAAPIIGAVIGAGGGALVGGGVGAIIGGVAGYLVGNAVA